MAAGIGTELFNLASSFDPYGAYREGGMAPQKYDIEQQKLDVQQQAMKEAQQELGGAKPAGMQAGAQPLAGMAKSMFPPGVELQTPDGIPTSSGLFQQQMTNSQQDLAASQISPPGGGACGKGKRGAEKPALGKGGVEDPGSLQGLTP